VATLLFTDIAAEQQTFYNRRLLDRALPFLPHGMFGAKYNIPKNGGNNAQWRRVERVAASTTALTEGSKGSPNNPSVSSVVATIAQYGQWSEHSDLSADQSIDNLIREYADAWGETAALSIDTVDRNVMTGGTVVQYASTATARTAVGSGMKFNTAELLEARRTLQTQNARGVKAAGGKFVVIMHTDTEQDWLQDSSYIAAQQYAGPRDDSNTLVSGQLRDYFGCRFYVTSNARVFVSLGLSGADVMATMVLGEQFYGTTELDAQQMQIIYKPRGSGGTEDPLNQRWTLGYKVAHTAVILNQNWGVRVEHVTSVLTGH
jgi:N4-gp56 family major capsid protein